jgi:hypothetical protein
VGPCQAAAWCAEEGAHDEHAGREVGLFTGADIAPVLAGRLFSAPGDSSAVRVVFNAGGDTWAEYTRGEQLRAETNRVRTHLLRLDALADQLDALREASPADEKACADPAQIRRVTVEKATLTPGSAAVFKQYGDLLRVAYDPAEQPLSAVAVMVGRQFGGNVEQLLLDAAAPPRQWTITTETGVTVRGHLPEWAESDPSKANIPANRLQLHVSDIYHRRGYAGPTVKVNIPGYDTDRYTGDDEILLPTMRRKPHSDDPADRIPVVVVEAVAGSDDWLGPFDPAGLCDLADKLRAHADLLDDVAAHLQDAREGWARNGGAK